MLEFSQTTVEVSDELVRRLTQLQLCRPADFRRARAGVRRLACDLPAFDSVWIDALVQLRKLTPFQARQLENGNADDLLIGPHVIVEELGHGPHGSTLLAKTPGRRDRVVLKRLNVAVEAIPECRRRLTEFIERSQGWSHPNLIVPHGLLAIDGQPLVTISRRVPGLTLSELLVRRGRLPATIVLEIGRQLAAGLATLHGRTLVHGDLRLSNVRLTTAGTVVAVDAGIRPAVCPELTIHATLALDAYDGIAPELIGTGVGANAGSEIYALGCLMWQLLTGRPPHAMADPLLKLAAHQTSRIADVRTLAPDAPAILADTLYAMTSPHVNERPRSFEDLLQRWGRPGVRSRSRLKRYRKHFDGAVPHFIQAGTPIADSRWAWTAVTLFVAAGMMLTFADRGMRNQLLTISRRVAEAVQGPASDPEGSDSPSNIDPTQNPASTRSVNAGRGLMPLPDPSPTGEILLTQAGPYDVAKIASARNVTVRGAPGISPIIQIGTEPLRLAGIVVTLENLTVRCEQASGQSPAAMLLVKSQELVIRGCAFERRFPERDQLAAPPQNSAVVAWQPLETGSESHEKSRIDIANSYFRVHGAAVWSAEVPRRVTMNNCLKLGDGTCLAVFPRAVPRPCNVSLTRVTLRETGPLLKLAGNFAEQVDAPPIEFVAHDCVFALAPTSTGLVELQSSHPRTDAALSVHMTGHGFVVPPDLKLMTIVGASAADSARPSVTVVADADEQFAGVLVSELQFVGPASGPPGNSVLEGLTAPRSAADANPGIEATHWSSARPR